VLAELLKEKTPVHLNEKSGVGQTSSADVWSESTRYIEMKTAYTARCTLLDEVLDRVEIPAASTAADISYLSRENAPWST